MTACKPSVPSKYIQPDDMEDLLVDIHIAQSMAQENMWDSLDYDYKQTLYYAAALKKHGVTKAEFDSSLTYYYIRADRFSDIYKNVARRLSDQALALGSTEGEIQHYANISNNSDTIDVWTGKFSVMLIPYPPYHRYDFVQKADTSFRKGDSFLFIVHTDFIYQSGSRSAQACITMKYDNDSIVSRVANFSSTGVNQVRIPHNGDHKVKEIRGYIYLAPEKEATTTLKLMAVKNIQLIKMRRPMTEEEKKDSVRSARKDFGMDIGKDSASSHKKEPIDTIKTKTK